MKWRKNKKLALVVIGVLLVFLVSPILTNRKEPAELQRSKSHAISPTPSVSFAKSGVGKNTKIVSDPAEVSAISMGKIEKMLNTPINFFGKVIDQNGEPVLGAQTEFIIVDSMNFSGHPTQPGPTSNGQGMFSIKGKHGASLSVRVSHPNYRTEGRGFQKVDFAYADRTDMEVPVKLPTIDDPCIFVLTKKNVAEELVYYERMQTRIPLDGRAVSINFQSGKFEAGLESVTITLVSNGLSIPNQIYKAYDWKADFSVPDGGIVERDSRVDFMAPEKGYVSKITIDRPSDMSRWDLAAEGDYYVRFSTGKFGRIRINISGKGLCKMDTWLNPKPKSRNLEYDATKPNPTPN